MSLKHRNLVGGAVACLIGVNASAQAAPWIEAGDSYARFRLQQAADRRQFDAVVTSWPLARSNARQAKADSSDRDVLLWNDLAGPRGGRIASFFRGNSDTRFIRGFESAARDGAEAGIELSYVGDRLAFALIPSYTADPSDDEEVRFDGSYLAGTFANWTLGAGYIDRWWGPGWQSSLILSSNARPVPSVWLDRRNTRQSEGWLLKWLGPWQFTTFMGRLEEERFVPDANLIGMRLNFRPFDTRLEVGLSRLIQWGGEGRPTNSDSLLDALLGRDNVGSDGIPRDASQDPGNQLAGIDLRYGFEVGERTLGLYTQVVGEDESGSLPARKVYQFGLDWTSALFHGEQQWFLEGADSLTEGLFGDEERPNYAYEHFNYRSGMRHLGRNIATTFDADARAITWGVHHFSGPAESTRIALTYAHLNRDGSTRFAKGAGEDIEYAVPATDQKVAVLDISHNRSMPGGQGSFYLSLASEAIQLADHELDQAIVGFEWQITLQ
ncbi:capsule assembly Wzi family protein [Gilvimarinus sp. F26214L]|uniref:capsule assembly Wzi family protein n=1 Tax=Gilvimarinus sp. DZF01 TaxID=3461371 RepID=UPI00404564E2